MSASQLQAKLSGELLTLNAAIAAMEAERRTLALPALSGDEEAMLRVVDLRTEIVGKQAGVRDLEQALGDLEPAVRVEKATERLRSRERLYAQYQAVSTDALSRMENIDAAIQQLAQALQEAAGPVEQARHYAIEITMPILGGDPGHQAVQRMMVAQNVGIRSVRELIETALEDVQVLTRQSAPYPRRPNLRLTETMRRSLAAVDARVVEALEADRRTSQLAGVVPEPA